MTGQLFYIPEINKLWQDVATLSDHEIHPPLITWLPMGWSSRDSCLGYYSKRWTNHSAEDCR